MTVQLETMIPVFSVSLTPHNYQPVEEFEHFYREHFKKKGAEAASAVEKVLNIEAALPQLSLRKSA
jgi:6,7-dimethyl-8-ribityllumazine synthase